MKIDYRPVHEFTLTNDIAVHQAQGAGLLIDIYGSNHSRRFHGQRIARDATGVRGKITEADAVNALLTGGR